MFRPYESGTVQVTVVGEAKPKETSNSKEERERSVNQKIDREEFIRVAKQHFDGYDVIPADVVPVVEEEEDVVIVTFPYPLEPNTHGPDYYARVTIDKKTKEIKQIKGLFTYSIAYLFAIFTAIIIDGLI